MILQYKCSFWLLPLLISFGYISLFIPVPLPWIIQVVPMAISYIWIGFILKRYQFPELKNAKWKHWFCYFILMILLSALIYTYREYLTINMKYNIYGIPILSLFCSSLALVSVTILAVLISKVDVIAKILAFMGGKYGYHVYVFASQTCCSYSFSTR